MSCCAVILSAGNPEAVGGFVTDNAPNNLKAFDIINIRHPQLVTIGCAAHAINLAIKDLCDPHHCPEVAKVSKQSKIFD
jgi:hypothetical protein